MNKYFKKSKRGGVIRDWLVLIIILIISAAILIYFVTKIMQTGMDKREVCRQSVVLRSKSVMELEPGRVLPLNCETQVYKIKTEDEDKVKRVIADAMYDCWYMMGEGKLDFLSDTDGKKACVICGIIKFDESMKGKKITGFTEYLINTKIPFKNITYIEYFLGGETEKIRENINIIEEGEEAIYTSKDYAIIFSVVEAPEREDFISAILVGGGIVGGAAKIGFLKSLLKSLGPKLFVATIVIGLVDQTIGLVQTYVKCGIGKGRCVSMLLIPYDAHSINENCKTILSIPPKEV